MPNLRTYEDVLALEPTAPERQLIEACKAGVLCALGDGSCPDGSSPERTIRADILRYLILGGCTDCVVDGGGVWLVGGYISGKIDMSFETAKGATELRNCHFDSGFDSIQSRFEMVNLSGSTLQGWRAQGAEITGDVFLGEITATASVDLAGATIGGQLACDGARLTASNGDALNAQGAKIKGSVFLRHTTATATVTLNSTTIGGQLDCTGAQLTASNGDALNAQRAKIKGGVFLGKTTATASVHLAGAIIGGPLACTGARFTASDGTALSAQGAEIKGDVFLNKTIATATINLAGATIGGQLSFTDAQLTASDGKALFAQRLRISESLIWRNVTVDAGGVSLNGAHAADLVDDPDRWPGRDQLILDGFTYDRIAASPTDAKTRIVWLKKGCYWEDEFYPQPFTHLAKVLRAMGHDADARKVLAERERLLRKDDRERRGDSGVWYAQPVNGLLWLWDSVLRGLAGYGHHPFRTVLWLFVFWLIAVSLSHRAWESGDFAPASAVLQNSQEWKALAAMDKADLPNPAKAWAERRIFEGERFGYTPGQDWETFNRYAYAADLVIPIIDLGQTDAWGPSTERGDWGRRLWRYGFFLQIAGWIVTALGAAAITGIIRRD